MRMISRILFVFTVSVSALCTLSYSQSRNKKNLIYVDSKGVMRYTSTNAEAAFFGVNYTTPFAHAYRAHKNLGVGHEEAIKNDVYHFARLGFDAFRVHVWDTEISDSAGNLLENEHLRLYDFLLAELKKRNIRTIITPIAFWGNGYPEPDDRTPGFSRYYGRGKLTTNDSAIKAQENFLKQFFNHVNPYTKQKYEDDPDVIAMEINNEPAHSDPKTKVTEYINRLAAAVKSTGWTKPVFYNIAQGPYFSDAVAASKVDGFSFQWYPSGLVGNQTMKGNTLMHVDEYRIPFRDTVTAFKNRALMVYEFDAADIMGSYMYPMMAKAFRQAGFQWASQFAYDPMAMANVNTEYQTHYLNLAYTPSKAISMLIASEVFHRVPRLKNWGRYPVDSSFDVFRVSYADALSEMNTAEKFYYSNTTATQPADAKKLRHIAGVGTSPVIEYDGSGAYFLDQLQEDAWRLELMPDVEYIRDPFERASPKKEVTAIRWNKNKMQISLDGLGDNFSIRGLSDGNNFAAIANGKSFVVSPGVYLISKTGATLTAAGQNFALGLKSFVAPKESKKEIVVRHEPFSEVSKGRAFNIRAIIGGLDSGKVFLMVNRLGGGLFRNIPMKKDGQWYQAEIPSDIVTDGQLQYLIVVQAGEDFTVYPGAVKSSPFSWENFSSDTYKTNIAAPGSAIELYNATTDRIVYVLPNFRRGFQNSYTSGGISGKLLQRFSITDMQANEVMGMQSFIGDKIQQRTSELTSQKKIIVRAASETVPSLKLKIILVDKYGTAFTANISISNNLHDIDIPLADFLPSDSSLLLPRPYPGFQPLYFKSSQANHQLDLNEIEKLQVILEAGMQTGSGRDFRMLIESVRLAE